MAERKAPGAERPPGTLTDGSGPLLAPHVPTPAGAIEPTLPSGGPPAGDATSASGTIADRYRIERELGRGGMGRVLAAHDLKLGRTVAIKLLHPGTQDERQLRRFEQEARAAASIEHRNIVVVHDVGVADGAPYIVSELLHGKTLRERLAGKPLALEQALDYTTQLAQGLLAAHDKGIVHRDLKPENLFITDDGLLKILDFGIAKLMDPSAQPVGIGHTETGTVLGTVGYMSPEQVRGDPADNRSDLFSVGAVIYEMLAGTSPFRRPTTVDTGYAILHDDPPPLPAQVPAEVDRLVRRCLEKSLARRVQSAREIVDALSTMQAQGPRQSSLFGELKRRRVFRTLIGYGVVAFALLQIAEPIMHGLHWPDAVLTYLVVALAAGFPIAVGLAWIFDVKGGRIERTEPAAGLRGLRLAALLFGIGALAAAPGVAWYLLAQRPAAPAPSSAPAGGPVATAPAPAPEGGPVEAAPRRRRAAAVMGFQNLSGRTEAAWLSTAVGEMLATELGGGDGLRIIPGETVARAKTDLALADAAGYGRDSLARLRQNLDVDYLVLGSYLVLGERGAGQLRLDVKVQDAASGETLASVSESGTLDDLLRVVSSAGEALRAKLGFGARSPDQADAVRTSLPSRPEAARRYAEGLARLRAGDSLGAEKLLARAAAVEPDHPLIRWARAGALEDLGRDAEATAEAKRAFANAASLSRDERIAVEARYRRLGNEWPKAVELYRTLVDYHPGEIEPALELAGAQANAGQPDEARATLAALRKLPLPASQDPRIDLAEGEVANMVGDFALERDMGARAAAAAEARGARQVAARGHLAEGNGLQFLGEVDRARAAIARAKQACADLGLRSCVKNCLNAEDLANVNEGRLADSARINRELLAGDLEQGSFVEAASSAGNLAFVLVLAGDLPAARPAAQQAEALNRRANVLRAAPFMVQAMLETAAGHLPRAHRLLTMGDAAAAKTGDRWIGGYLLYLRGDLLRAEGNLAGARKTGELALAAARELQVAWFIDLAEILVAEIAVDDGRASEVEAMLRPTLEGGQGRHGSDRLAYAQLAVARARLALGDTGRAREMAEQAAPRIQVTEEAALRLRGGITLARIRASSGMPDDVAEARRALDAVRAEALRRSLVEPALAARLALAPLEPDARRPVSLAAVEKEARAKGYFGIARAAARR